MAFKDSFSEDQSLNYFRRTPHVGWAALAAFPTVGDWHAAANILSRQGIVSRMKMDDSPQGGVNMLVLETETETARQLLHSNSISFTDPADEPSAPPTFLPSTPYVPPRQNHPAQFARSRRPVIIFLIWIMLAISMLITKSMLHWMAVSPVRVTLPKR